jgi:hypothetical protein
MSSVNELSLWVELMVDFDDYSIIYYRVFFDQSENFLSV